MKNRVLHFKIALLILQTLFTLQSSFAQVSQEWVRRYAGPVYSNDYAKAIAVDGSGNVYVTGYGLSDTETGVDYVTIKYNTDGVQQWVRKYSGTGNGDDQARSIKVDQEGNVYITGMSSGSGTRYDYATIKYNTDGIQQWVLRYNGLGNGDDEAHAIAIDQAGNVYVTGTSNEVFSSDITTIKYDPNGILQWVGRYSGPGSGGNGGQALVVDIAGNVYVTGPSYGSKTNADYATIKYNSSGVQMWVQRYNGPDNNDDSPSGIAVDVSGNVYVTGFIYIANGLGTDYCTIKYNSDGVQQWVQTYNGPGNFHDVATAIAVDHAGNVYVTGYSSKGSWQFNYATIKYNTEGVQQWLARYDGPTNFGDEAYAIALDSSGNVYVTGGSEQPVTFYDDYVTIKYNNDGVQQWIQLYNGPGNGGDCADAIAVDNSGNVFVTGSSAENSLDVDYATIKYSQFVGINPISSELPDKYYLYQNYPNPFNAVTKIRFSLPLPSKGGVQFIQLRVYDILGREVETVVPPLGGGQEGLQPGTYEVTWDGTNYPSGVYFYKIEAVNYIETRKMVLLK